MGGQGGECGLTNGDGPDEGLSAKYRAVGRLQAESERDKDGRDEVTRKRGNSTHRNLLKRDDKIKGINKTHSIPLIAK